MYRVGRSSGVKTGYPVRREGGIAKEGGWAVGETPCCSITYASVSTLPSYSPEAVERMARWGKLGETDGRAGLKRLVSKTTGARASCGMNRTEIPGSERPLGEAVRTTSQAGRRSAALYTALQSGF